MQIVEEYNILSNTSPRGLSDQVNIALKEGWHLYGSVEVGGPSSTSIRNYVQAMVRYKQRER